MFCFIIRTRDSSLSTSGKNNELQDMKALFSEISDVGFKQKNAFGDLGKIHSTLTGIFLIYLKLISNSINNYFL